MLSLDQRIRCARRHARLSQTQLAQRIGVQRTAISQWEQPQGTHPTSRNLVTVACATGVCLNWLAHGTGTMLATGADRAAASHAPLDEFELRLLRAFRRVNPVRRGNLVALFEAAIR